MPRVGLLNMCLGFLGLILAGFMGVFNSFDLTDAFLKGEGVISKWELVLFDSAHGHVGLFAMIHILFGLTLPYSNVPPRFWLWQTLGLFCGLVAMIDTNSSVWRTVL